MARLSVAVTTAVGGWRREQPAEGVGAGGRVGHGGDDVVVVDGHAELGEALDERRLALADVAVRALADEPDPAVPEGVEVVDADGDPGAVVDVDGVDAGERAARSTGRRRGPSTR